MSTWDEIKGSYRQLWGKMKQQWGKSTDDNLVIIEGKRDELVGKMQQQTDRESGQSQTMDTQESVRNRQSIESSG